MNRTKSWRWLESALLTIAILLAILIVGALVAGRLLGRNTTADFRTVFVFEENASLASSDYQWSLLVVAIVMAFLIGFIAFRYIRVPSVFGIKLQFAPYIFAAVITVGVSIVGLKVSADDYASRASDCARLQAAYDSQQYRVTEGLVHVLHTWPSDGLPKIDILKIGGVEIKVDHFVNTCGYVATLNYGGVLKEGIYARVYYADHGAILRIDVKDQ